MIRYGLKWDELTDEEQQEFIELSKEVLEKAARNVARKLDLSYEWIMEHYTLFYDLAYEEAPTGDIDALIQYVEDDIIESIESLEYYEKEVLSIESIEENEIL